MKMKSEVATSTLHDRIILCKSILDSDDGTALLKQSAVTHVTKFAFTRIKQEIDLTTSSYLDILMEVFDPLIVSKFYSHLLGFSFYSSDLTGRPRNEELVSLITVDYPKAGIIDKGLGHYDEATLTLLDDPWNFT